MNFRTNRLVAILLGTSITFASAHALSFGGCMGSDAAGRSGKERFADRIQQHQQRLHDALKLSSDQEAAWKRFQDSHPATQSSPRPDRAEFARLTAPERAEKVLDWQKQHHETMTKHLMMMKEFYAQLTPEQKKTFDEQSMPRQRKGGRSPRSE